MSRQQIEVAFANRVSLDEVSAVRYGFSIVFQQKRKGGCSVTDQTVSRGKAGSVIESNIGTYLARRLIDIGVEDYFVVPGDYNLLLLDQILKFPELRLISCCNELYAG